MKPTFRLLVILFLLIPFFGEAHFPNQSYIFLRIYEKDGIEGRFEINTREVNKVFGLSLTKNVTKEELLPYIPKIQAYLLRNTSFSSKFGEHEIVLSDYGVLPVALGAMVQIHFKLTKMEELPKDLTVNYNSVFEKDNTHRAFLITEYNWGAGIINQEANITLSFTPEKRTATMDITESSVWKGFVEMVRQGIWHIWIGLDHILFLLALILPSVVRRTAKEDDGFISWNWVAVKQFKPAFLYIIKIITFFTIAHTITLSLATLELVVLPGRIVESIIAFSIGLAAYHNIRPIFKGRDWVIAFVFGLFHGFGFASVLGDLGLTGEFLTLSLLGFNVGVEIGQLAIIALIFPVLFILRKWKSYSKILVYGSILLILISLYWCIERIFEVNLGIGDLIVRAYYKALILLGLK